MSEDLEDNEDAQTYVMDAAKEEKKPASTKEPKMAMEFSLMMAPLALIAIAVSCLGLLSLTSAEGDLGWIAELCASLRCQVVVVLLICALPFLFTRSLRLVSGFLISLALINIGLLCTLIIPIQAKADAKDYLSFQVYQTKMEDKKSWEEIAKQVTEIGPDIFCVENLDAKSVYQMKAILPTYIRGGEFPDDKGTGIGIFCNKPMSNIHMKKVGPDKLPMVTASCKFEFGECNIVALMAPPPSDAASFKKRNEYLNAVALEVTKLQGPIVVTGLFNITPYGAAFANMNKAGNLQDGRKGNGVIPNWHWGPTDIMINRFPVDHFLVSQNIEVQQYSVKPNTLGGTHAPILGKFQIQEGSASKSGPIDAPAAGPVEAAADAQTAPTAPAKKEPAAKAPAKGKPAKKAPSKKDDW